MNVSVCETAADVAELADALASGASGLRLVEVRILSSAFFIFFDNYPNFRVTTVFGSKNGVYLSIHKKPAIAPYAAFSVDYRSFLFSGFELAVWERGR